jgi:hypothetical protein
LGLFFARQLARSCCLRSAAAESGDQSGAVFDFADPVIGDIAISKHRYPAFI